METIIAGIEKGQDGKFYISQTSGFKVSDAPLGGVGDTMIEAVDDFNTCLSDRMRWHVDASGKPLKICVEFFLVEYVKSVVLESPPCLSLKK